MFDILNSKARVRVLEDGKQQVQMEIFNSEVRVRVLEYGKLHVQMVGLADRRADYVEDAFKLIQHGSAPRTSRMFVGCSTD